MKIKPEITSKRLKLSEQHIVDHGGFAYNLRVMASIYRTEGIRCGNDLKRKVFIDIADQLGQLSTKAKRFDS